MDDNANEEELLTALINAIEAMPEGRATIADHQRALARHSYVDAIVHADIGGRAVELVVEAKREAFPRDVRSTIYQLRTYLAHYVSSKAETIPFFIARAISPGARDLLQAEGIGYYDLGGSLYIPGKSLFVHIDRPAPRRSKKTFDSIFQGQRARTLLYVYEHHDDWLSVKRIAEEAQVSAATASETLSELERREWVMAEGAGPAKRRRLSRPDRLIDAWTHYAETHKPLTFERFYVSCGDINDLMRRLDRACAQSDVAYAITGEMAAQLYAPYLSAISQVRCRIVPGARAAEALDRLNAKPVAEGWNLAVIETAARGDVTVGMTMDGINFAPPLQVYLDLLQGSGRSKEMAGHLRSERLAN